MFSEDSIHKTSSKAWGRPTTFLAILVEEMLLGRTKVCIGTCGGHEFLFLTYSFLKHDATTGNNGGFGGGGVGSGGSMFGGFR